MIRIFAILAIFFVGAVVTYHNLNLYNDDPLTEVNVTAALMPVAVTKPKVKPESSLSCLTKTIYFEAANQGTDGMTAVANVVMNRLQDDSFPATVCEVAYQTAYVHGKTVCQFSWRCDGKNHRIYHNAAWTESKDIAQAALKGVIDNLVGDAKYFHAVYVMPAWAAEHKQVGVIGDHIFYE